jgi:hypothetical protein
LCASREAPWISALSSPSRPGASDEINGRSWPLLVCILSVRPVQLSLLLPDWLVEILGNVRQAPNATAKALSIWSVDRNRHVRSPLSVSVLLPLLLPLSRLGLLLKLVHWIANVGGDGWPSCWNEPEITVLCLRPVTSTIGSEFAWC